VEPVAEPVTFENIPVQNEYVEEIAPVVEPVAEPVVEETVEPAVEEKGKETKIGDTIVSDKNTNANIIAVANKFGVQAANLVSIEATEGMPMVFEFLYNDMRNDATLISVYFMMDGEATLPPETDRENVLAFGRNFITGNADLKEFLA
ncbi:MAG: hypothetical protein MJ143_03700, partial [Clostridia bacterium]|nr:hypothetical protein [Clostridia bacterium]